MFHELFASRHLAMHPAAALQAATSEPQAIEGRNPYAILESGARVALGSEKAQGKMIAVQPIFGTMLQHAPLGLGADTSRISRDLRQLDSDPNVGAIVLEIHSPGGQVWGTEELADTVWDIREGGRTRIVSHANSMAASAALWVGSQAEAFYATPNAELGSIGVLSIHEDYSKMLEEIGIAVTLLATPEKKVDGNPFQPLSDETRKEILSDNQRTYERFVSQVARGRGVTTSTVKSKFGGGGMLFAERAEAAGLVDGVMSIDQVLRALQAPAPALRSSAAVRLRQAHIASAR